MKRILILLSAVLFVPIASANDVDGDGRISILVPLAMSSHQSVNGALGTEWKVEIWAVNHSSVDIRWLQPGLCPAPCRAEFPSGFVGRVSGVASNRGNGAVFFLPNYMLGEFEISARFLETTRRAQPTGVEVPVIHEGEFLREQRWILGVPTGKGFRSALRIYDPRAWKGTTVNIDFIDSDGQVITSTVMRPGDDPLAHDDPTAFPSEVPTVDAVFDLTATFPQLSQHERFHVRMTPNSDAAYWGMVSVTDNETQHVLLITPQP